MIRDSNPEVPPRCTLHQVIKSQAYDVSNPYKKCCLCKYYTRDLSSAKCKLCLISQHLINFSLDLFVASDQNWRWYIDKLEEQERLRKT